MKGNEHRARRRARRSCGRGVCAHLAANGGCIRRHVAQLLHFAEALLRHGRLGGEVVGVPALGLVDEDVLEQDGQAGDRADSLVRERAPAHVELDPAAADHAHLDLVAQVQELGCLALTPELGRDRRHVGYAVSLPGVVLQM